MYALSALQQACGGAKCASSDHNSIQIDKRHTKALPGASRCLEFNDVIFSAQEGPRHGYNLKRN